MNVLRHLVPRPKSNNGNEQKAGLEKGWPFSVMIRILLVGSL